MKPWMFAAVAGAAAAMPRSPHGQPAKRRGDQRFRATRGSDDLDYHFKLVPYWQALQDLLDTVDAFGITEDDIIQPVGAFTDVLYLDLLQIPENHRGHGWGKRFASTIIRHGMQRGAAGTVLLAAPLFDQAPSQAFWTHMGFSVLAQGVDDWGEPAAIMWKANNDAQWSRR